jgi:hypothetical protein
VVSGQLRGAQRPSRHLNCALEEGSRPSSSGSRSTLSSRRRHQTTRFDVLPRTVHGRQSRGEREVVPDLRRLAILGNVGGPAVVLDMREVQAAARTLGLEVIPLEVRRGEDIAPALESLKGRAEALYVVIDPLVGTHRIRINTWTTAAVVAAKQVTSVIPIVFAAAGDPVGDRVDHGTICGRSCANSGHYKPLAPVLIAPLSIQIRRAGVQKKFGPAQRAHDGADVVGNTTSRSRDT